MSARGEWTGCASVPASSLAALAEHRRLDAIRVIAAGPSVWIAWRDAAVGIVERVRSLPGSEVYECRDGLWYRSGCRLPAFGPPRDWTEGMSLSRAIIPAQVRPIEVGTPRTMRPLQLQLVVEDCPHATSALRCPLNALAAWADHATSRQLAAVLAAYAEEEVFLTGRVLPPLAGATRFWGREVLVPLRLRAEPAVTEAALRAVLGVENEALLILDRDGYETVPKSAFRPLTRAGIRLARQRAGGSA